jgi:hypothetical protein
MKTIRIVFVGGPECGNTRVAPDNIPAIKIPIVSEVVWVAGSDAPPDARSARFHQYVATDEKDSNKNRIFRYVGEQ